MNCIIIDDEQTARAIISQLCSETNDLNVVEEFSNALQAIKYLNQHEIELIFLDIHMPDFTGFDFIETLKKPPKIILTTSDDHFAIQAFEYECIVDYLLKPVTPERFKKAIHKVAGEINILNNKDGVQNFDSNSAHDLYVNIDRRLIKIDIQKICLVEAKGDYINIKTETDSFRVHSSLKKIKEKLPEQLFVKVHRSFIINIEKIIDIEDNSVLINKDVIPVSRSNRSDLMKRLNLL